MTELSVPPLRRVTLVITGGIAAYKSCEFLRLLVKNHIDVQVVMTKAAERFVTPLTFEALSGKPVITETSNAMPHIEGTRDTDLTIVMPATANTLAKMAQGIADNLVSSLLLAHRSPVLVVPGMNRFMWENPATQRNVAQLKADGVLFAGPVAGFQACGDVGYGRMMSPEDVWDLIPGLLAPKPLTGRRAVVTAGPTVEALDPVRAITNRSSGQQGFALARALRDAGADVTLIAGPTTLSTPTQVTRIDVTSAQSMFEAVQAALETPTDCFVGVAAVCDYRPETVSEQKMKKDGTPFLGNVTWTENPDILAWVGQNRKATVVAGFAAETDDARRETYARGKLEKKNADIIAANRAQDALESATNALTLYTRTGDVIDVSDAPKLEVARAMVAAITRLLTA